MEDYKFQTHRIQCKEAPFANNKITYGLDMG